MNLILLFIVWLVSTIVAGAYLGVLAAIAWRVAQWLI